MMLNVYNFFNSFNSITSWYIENLLAIYLLFKLKKNDNAEEGSDCRHIKLHDICLNHSYFGNYLSAAPNFLSNPMLE